MLAGPSNAGDAAGVGGLGGGGADARFVAFPGGIDAGGGDDGAGLALASRMAVGGGAAGARGEEATGAGALPGRAALAAFLGAAFARCSTSGSNCLSRSR